MAIENKPCSLTYFLLQILIIIAEISIGIYWVIRTQDIPALVMTKSTFGIYHIERNMEWTQMQMEMNCCGVKSAYDYSRMNLSVPKECCISEPSISTYRLLITVFDKPCMAAYVRKRGCNVIFETGLEEERIIITAFLFSGAMLKMGMLAASFLIPFEEITEEIGWSPVGSQTWLKPKEPIITTTAV